MKQASVYYRRKGKVTSVRIQKTMYALSSDNNKLLEMNTTGAMIWKLLQKQQTVETLTDQLYANFSPKAASKTKIKKDVQAFVAVLLKHKFIVKR